MTQNSADDSDKREATSFFSKWMKNDKSKDENWDEVCIQWCKQQKKSRNEQMDPNCSMLCFKSPLLNNPTDNSSYWNPLKGYSVSVIHGKQECSSHTEGMSKSTVEDIAAESQKKHEIDFGNVWNETGNGLIYVYQQSKEQAKDWKNGPQAAKIKEYAKEQADILYFKLFQSSPPESK